MVLGNLGDKYEVIRKYHPDILAFGYDQSVKQAEIQKFFPYARIIVIAPYQTDVYKSSLLKKRMSI